MTDAVKKTTKKAATTATKAKAAAKTSKSTAAANGHPSNKSAAVTNGHNSSVTAIGISHEQTALLAHRFWTERGYAHGYDAEDWFRAEQELRGKAS